MIPRFIVKNSIPALIKELTKLGYLCGENPVPEHILVIGNSICQATPPEKNQLICTYDFQRDGADVILAQARLHQDWSIAMLGKGYKTVKVGTKNTNVHITTVGILIDSFVVPVQVFERVHDLINVDFPGIVTHKPQFNHKAPFITIGCADYSLDDFNKIMREYNSLTPKV